MNLYILATDYQKVWNMVEDEDCDLMVVEDTLQSIEGAIEQKVSNIVNFVQSLNADIDFIKSEEKRLADRRKAIENKQRWIKEYMQQQMEIAGLEKIKTPTHTITVQKNPPSLEITDKDIIPANYLTVIPEYYEIDKARVKEALKSGEEVPGAILTQGKSLRIR